MGEYLVMSVQMHVHMCACVCRSQKLMLGFFLNCSLIFFFSELTDVARPAGQQAHRFLALRLEMHMCMPGSYVSVRDLNSRSLCMQDKHFIFTN